MNKKKIVKKEKQIGESSTTLTTNEKDEKEKGELICQQQIRNVDMQTVNLFTCER